MIDPIKFTFGFDANSKQIIDELFKNSCFCDDKNPIDFSDVPRGNYPSNPFVRWNVIFDTNVGEIEVHVSGNDAQNAINIATMNIRSRDNIDWWKVKSAKIHK